MKKRRKTKKWQVNTVNRVERQSRTNKDKFKNKGRSDFAQALQIKYNPKSTFKMLEAVSGITKREFLEFFLFLEQHDIKVSKFFTYMVKMWSEGKSETREYFASTISDLLIKNKKATEHKINLQRKKFVNLEKQRQLIQSQFDFVFSSEEIDNILEEINENLDRTTN